MRESLSAIADPNNLRFALNCAKEGAKQFFYKDFIRHQDYVHDANRLLGELSIRLLKQDYQPRKPLEIEIPKSGLAVRPGTILDFEDFIAIYAILLPHLKQIDRRLPDNVYSWRLADDEEFKPGQLFKDRPIPILPYTKRKEIQPFEEWYTAWPEFDRATRNAIEKKGFTHLVTSDITAYFENISHDVLKACLLQCMNPEAHYPINLLIEILSFWTVIPPHGNRIARGIPQGNDISSYLGNVYLLPLDRALCRLERERGIKYLRYMDDVKILTKSRKEAMNALLVMNRILRELQLNVQGAKTDIFERDEVLEQLEHPQLEAANKVVERALKESKRGPVSPVTRDEIALKLKPYIQGLPRKKLGSKDTRLLKRTLTGLIAVRSGIAVPKAMSHFIKTPAITDKVIRYFKGFRTGPTISEFAISWLARRDDIFEYQATRLLEIFVYKNSCPPKLHKTLLEILARPETHWAMKTNSLIALSFLGIDNATRKKLWEFQRTELNYFVKRAYLLCFISAGPLLRNSAIQRALADSDRRVVIFAKYISDILHDRPTQNYEIGNLARLHKEKSDLFIDESYKLLLLQDAGDSRVLTDLIRFLSSARSGYFPTHIRWRMQSALTIARKNLKAKSSASM